MIESLVKAKKRLAKWWKDRAERNRPEYVYLSRASDLSDLERRMRNLANDRARTDMMLYYMRGL